MKIQEKYIACINAFKIHNPNPKTELDFSSGFELLVAVILSAQCTDKRVNAITPELFKAFPTAEIMAQSSADEIFEYIRSCSYPNNKAKHLFATAQMLTEKFNGSIPTSIDDLQTLPGVGRKTANVVASVLFGTPTMPVDTHVFRVSQRIGLVAATQSLLEVEKKLTKYTPAEYLNNMHHWLILHGRYVCTARSPKCESCFLQSVCDYYKKLPSITK